MSDSDLDQLMLKISDNSTFSDECFKGVSLKSSKQLRSLVNKSFILNLQIFAVRNGISSLSTAPTEIHDGWKLFKSMFAICKEAQENSVSILIDAEQTYLQAAIHTVTLDLIRIFNREGCTVFATYQCYLKKTLSSLAADLRWAEEENFVIGGKIVRGGYMDEERRLAQLKQYEDPVNPTYDATTATYYDAVECCINHLRRSPKSQILFATHNAQTAQHVVNRTAQLPIDCCNRISAAQLVGMRDHISGALSTIEFDTYKLLHYGPVLQAVEYLSRRILENRSGMKTADEERRLIGQELQRRARNCFSK